MDVNEVVKWVAAGRRPEARRDGRGWVIDGTRRGFVLPTLCLVAALVFSFGVTQARVTRRDRLILLAIGATAALAAAVWAREHHCYWLRIDDDGLSERRLMDLWPPRRVPWEGLELTTPLGMAAVLTHRSGRSIQVARDAPLDGLGTLLQVLAERLPRQRGEVIAAAEVLGLPAPLAADPAEDWVDGVPRLYPDLRGVTLESFLTPAAAKALGRLPRVEVHPFVDPSDDPSDQRAGAALSRVLIRDLMLLRSVSVRGPEDTPPLTLAALEADGPPEGEVTAHVTGRVRLEGDRMVATLLVTRGGTGSRRIVLDETAGSLHVACATALAAALDADVDDRTLRRWRALLPSVAALVRHGQIVLEGGDAVAAFRLGSNYPTVLHEVGDGPAALRALVEGLERDPFDAQLCFHAFLAVWTGTGPQDCALQFARKAIELSPGHGKAHMVLPHVSRSRAGLLHHSELAYRLLPGNIFALTNYINYSREAGRSGTELLPLVEQAVLLDPESPLARTQAIEALREAGELGRALEHAEALASLYGPPINPRTLHCLRQNPRMEEALRRGEVDLTQEARDLIDELQAARAKQARTDP